MDYSVINKDVDFLSGENRGHKLVTGDIAEENRGKLAWEGSMKSINGSLRICIVNFISLCHQVTKTA
ncbi:hypothetical protein VNO78_34197 [Psophocarpus tetragonolobus]|uniref:Uncharacterized protein n=1 Tax=Psophocarpus tetragonolobus TaxID=3891 RepID=A0AAN9NVG6_PSOTE